MSSRQRLPLIITYRDTSELTEEKLDISVSPKISQDDGYCSPPLRTLQRWVERSSTQPLKLDLASEFPDYSHGFRRVNVPIETLRALRAIICHARDLDIEVPADPYFDMDEDCYTTDDEADLEDLDDRERLMRLELKKKSESLPPLLPSQFRNLRKFTWSGTSRRFLRYPLPWAQLYEITLKTRGAVVSSKTCLDLLNQCTSLSTFSAKVISRFDPLYEGDRVTAHRLTRLDIKGTPDAFTSLFRHLRARNLASLRMCIKSPYGPEDDYYEQRSFRQELFPVMKSFFRTNQKALTSLTFRGVDISSEQLLVLLRLVSGSLTSLEIEEAPCFDEAIVTAMTVSPETLEEPLCPYITHLTLEKSLPDDPDLPDGLLAEMVESRCESYPFSDISILTNPRPYVLEDAVRIEALRKNGELNSFSWWQEGIAGDDHWL